MNIAMGPSRDAPGQNTSIACRSVGPYGTPGSDCGQPARNAAASAIQRAAMAALPGTLATLSYSACRSIGVRT